MLKEEAIKLSKQLRLSYFTSKYWLEFLCEYKNKNGEDLAYIKFLETGKYISQYTPKKTINLQNMEINLATEDEMNDIINKVEIFERKQMMSEYFFETKEIIELNGKKHKKNRYAINSFLKKYNYEITHEYEKDKIMSFLKEWDIKQKLKTAPYERGLNFCYYLLDFINKDENLKFIFVTIDGKLVGFSIGELLNQKQWIALHQKVDYSYNNLGRWLFWERAKLFSGIKEFANGGTMGDKGIEEFKKSLRPNKILSYFFIKTGRLK